MSDPLLAQMSQPPALPNLRRPRPEPEAAAEAAAEPAAPKPAPAQRTRRERPRVVPEPTAPEPDEEPDQGGRPATGNETRGMGLPIALAERVRAKAEEAQLPLGEYLMAALDRQWEKLEEVYPPLPKRRPELPPARRIPRRRVPGGRQPVNFRLAPEQTEALRTRQDQLGVKSRSEFVTALLQLDLDGKV